MQTHTASTSSSSSSRPNRRLVPDQLRKRAAVSCDFCKVRRRKCIRTTPQGPCRLCRDNGVECVASIPRKPRSQASSEDRCPRCRVLDDLFRHLFPGVAVDDTQALERLRRAAESGRLVVAGGDAALSMPGSGPASAPVPAAALPEQPPSGSAAAMTQLPKRGSTAPAVEAVTSHADPPGASYELLLQNPHGTLAYFGPSGSMAFVRQMRELLALTTKDDTESLADAQKRLQESFIHDRYAHTMGEDDDVVPELQSSSQGLDAGWAVCLRLVLAFGCERRSFSAALPADPDPAAASARLLALRRQLVRGALAEVPHLILSTTLPSVTALTLLSIYLSFANERNAAWTMSGCAIRIAMGMGLHRGEQVLRRSNIYRSPIDKELHKQVWCSLYIFEQYTSALLGRPSAVDGADILTELPRESLLDQGYYRPPGLLQHDVALARILSRVRRAQIDQRLDPSVRCDGLPDVPTCEALLRQLEDWRRGIPSFLEFDETNQQAIHPNHFRQIVMIHVRYQYARILLSRPFLLKAVLISHVLREPQAADPAIGTFKRVCFRAAADSWLLIRSLWAKNEYNATLWLDGIFAYQCTLILSLYMLSKTTHAIAADHAHQNQLHEMLEQMMEILQKGPGNRTMRRLVQISRDFNDIVSLSSVSPSGSSSQMMVPHEADPSLAAHATAVAHHRPPPLVDSDDMHHQAGLGALPAARLYPAALDNASLNLGTLLNAEWLEQGYMDGNFGFDFSMADFGLDV
ncbi:Transcription factor [Niveomyces insectorum RCEF 264]|uniref:Transcription factor n=1 Tax=Niveomyces insectorum RCEF 264 TaxID=1081102 RepID=A0A167NSE9_9HYPO|nr:Transcription factor [Niveomyces insectorum RCEF 264]